jgi:hypothetical protein
MRNDFKIRPRSNFRGGGIALRGMGAALRGGGIAQRGMGVALKDGGKLFGGKETYKEELGEAKAVASKKISPKQFVKGEKSEKHKGEELKSLAKQAKSIKSGKMSPEEYAKMETSEPMKKGGSALKKVDSKKNPGLSKLPTSVRNKMGYMKKGGKAKNKK